MLSWLLLALAATIVVALALQHWKQSRKLRRARKPAAPRLPVVLAHGFLGFDETELGNRKHPYFRGIGEQLERAGAQLYCPRVPPASSISARAARLADLIRAVPEPRVNIVAHSMGGLDARYAISKLGLADRVASLVTIGTPHFGTPLADLGAGLVPGTVSRALSRVVDVRALHDLTTDALDRFNRDVADAPGVAYCSVVARSAFSQTNPLLWPSHAFLTARSGANDGMVPADSQGWGKVIREIESDHWGQ